MNSSKAVILVVDDELSIRESFNLILSEKYNVIIVASGEAALKKVADQKIDLVFLDMRMPGMDGIETLKRLKQIDRDVTVTMVTAVNDVQKANEAIKFGAEDYLVKPFNVSDILDRTEHTLKKKGLFIEARSIHSGAAGIANIEIPGATKKMRELNDMIVRSANGSSPVLIQGEAGVETLPVAQKLHGESGRPRERFFHLAIAGGDARELKKKLFGCESGMSAQTLEMKKGLIELADGGTLFLENIERLPEPLQFGLLEVIRREQFKREDGTPSIPVHVRIVCSTSSDLQAMSKEGGFSADLFQAISKTVLNVPPLRERASDIPMLVEHLVEKFNRIYGREIEGLSADAMEIISSYPFPGNILELGSMIEALIFTEEGTITADRLPFYVLAGSASLKATAEGREITYDKMYDELERTYMDRIIASRSGDVNKAAKVLGISTRALESKREQA